VKSFSANFAEFVALDGRSRGRIISEQPLLNAQSSQPTKWQEPHSTALRFSLGSVASTSPPPTPHEVTAADFFDRKPWTLRTLKITTRDGELYGSLSRGWWSLRWHGMCLCWAWTVSRI